MTATIRNFCIIAHIDHGKSTLADRFLQATHAVGERDFHDLMLDSMELERERGITIKASSVTMFHEVDGERVCLNLIDTPGHVDFGYEVSRSLRACEGAILLVDANQGVEAQTVAVMDQARACDLAIIPVVTKIDLPDSQPIETMIEMEHTFGIDPDDILAVSGKSGEGVPELLDHLVKVLPAPAGDPDAPVRALIFDSVYDAFRGVIAHVRVVDGCLDKGAKILMAADGQTYDVLEVGIFTPAMVAQPSLNCGEVGYLVTGVKDIRGIMIGDTVLSAEHPETPPLPSRVRTHRPIRIFIHSKLVNQFHDSGSSLDLGHLV